MAVYCSIICVNFHFFNQAPVITSFYDDTAVLTHRCYWVLVIISMMLSLTVINLEGGHVTQLWFRKQTSFLLHAPECLSPHLMPVNFSPTRFSPTLTSSSGLFPLLWLVDMHPHLYHHCPPHSCNVAESVPVTVTREWSMTLMIFEGRPPHKPQWGWEGPEQQVPSSMWLVCSFVCYNKKRWDISAAVSWEHSVFPFWLPPSRYSLVGSPQALLVSVPSWVGDAFN